VPEKSGADRAPPFEEAETAVASRSTARARRGADELGRILARRATTIAQLAALAQAAAITKRKPWNRKHQHETRPWLL
jgi:hypothetical protein